ncbi:MAG: DUF2335 domain-containing protein [Acidobacteria bacterium]|nr:DUF2335 domain-containing protein [Acidobacteriota bacterium]
MRRSKTTSLSKRNRNRQISAPPQHAVQQRPGYALVSQQELRVAPLPKPEELAQFEAVLPGLAERIVTMAEENGRDRRLNNRTMRWVTILGQVFAFTIMMTALLGGFYLVQQGQDSAGVAAIVTAIGAPLATFVYNRKRSSQP